VKGGGSVYGLPGATSRRGFPRGAAEAALGPDPPPSCVPGMVDSTVYVGSNLQGLVRLATGSLVQASIANTGGLAPHSQGDSVLVHLPQDALRLLAASNGAVTAASTTA
jgi:TOBE domain-containing protein